MVLATFGAVATYGAVTMRNLGDELRLVSRGYLDLRLQVSELYTAQTNLLKELETLKQEGPARTRLIKPDLDTARRVRLMKLPKTLDDVRRLEELRSSAEEHALLNQVRTRLRRVESEYRADEELFDEAFGPIGDLTLLAGDTEKLRPARERLWRQEETIRKHLSNLGVELKLRSEQASLAPGEGGGPRGVGHAAPRRDRARRRRRRHADGVAHLAAAAHARRSRQGGRARRLQAARRRRRRPTRSARSGASSTPWPRRSTSASSGSSAPSASPPSARSPRRSRTRCAIRCRRSA